MYFIIILFILLGICLFIMPIETFEQVKIKLDQNPLNINLNNSSCNQCSNEPEIVVPVYAPWRTYWPARTIYPYYPFYPYYYNNYYY